MSIWDERYSDAEFVYGTDPNEFVAAEAHRIPPGPVLCLAEGEGRNAVHLAGLSHPVTAVDGSKVGMEKARGLAHSRGVEIETIVADLAEFTIAPNHWSGIVSTSAHLPPEIRRRVHRGVVEGLRPDGVFILEAYTPRQHEIGGIGGPGKDRADYLMTLDGLRQELEGLEFVIGRELVREMSEGKYHRGPGAVVQVVAMKRP